MFAGMEDGMDSTGDDVNDPQRVTWRFFIGRTDVAGQPLDCAALDAKLQEVASGIATDDMGGWLVNEEGLLEVQVRLPGFPGVAEMVLQDRGVDIVRHQPATPPIFGY